VKSDTEVTLPSYSGDVLYFAVRPIYARIMPPAVGGIKRYRDPSQPVSLSVPWRSCHRRAAALGYRHADCLQLSHVRTADPSADGRRSATSRTAIGGGMSSRRPGAITCRLCVVYAAALQQFGTRQPASLSHIGCLILPRWRRAVPLQKRLSRIRTAC